MVLELDPAAQQNLPSAGVGRILTEAGAAHVHDRIAEIPMVEDVEELRPELQGDALLQLHPFEECEVLVVQAGTAERVLPEVAELCPRIRQG